MIASARGNFRTPEDDAPRRHLLHSEDPVDRREKSILLGLLILVITIVAYLPTFRAGFIWDDPDYVVNNPTLRDLEGLKNIWLDPSTTPQYYPLVHTSFWIEYHLWGLWPTGYHVDNVLLHALGAILLWRILRFLSVPGCFFAALIWAVHPVNVESVAWVTERKNVLCGVFYFSSLLVFLKDPVVGLRDSESTHHPITKSYGLSLLLFICALLSKTVAASMPVVALILIWWKRHGRITRQQLLGLLPFFALGIPAGLYTAHLERVYVGATGKEWSFTFPDRVMIAGRAVWFYISKIILPIHLSFIYPKWDLHIHRAAQFLAPACVILVLALSSIRRSVFAAVLIFGVIIFPALGFSNIYPMRYSFVADHFQYLACAAIIALIVPLLMRVRTVLAIIVIIFAISTFIRAQVYHDPLILWTDTLQKNPNSFMVHFNYGEALLDLSKQPGTSPAQKHELEQKASLERFRAMELAPDLPETHWNVGVDYEMEKNFNAAMNEFHKTLQLDPNFAPAYNSMGDVYLEQGDLDRAYANFDKATQLQSGYATAQYNAGVVLEKKGDILGAIDRYTRAIAGKRDYADAHYNLANCLMRIGQLDYAIAEYQQVLRYEPKKVEAMTNLGAALLQRGRAREAAEQFHAALAIKPDLIPAQRGLAAAEKILNAH